MENRIWQSDNFIFMDVTDKAKEIYNSGLFQLYALHGDNTESAIESDEDLNAHLENGISIGIEVGFLPTNKNYIVAYLLRDQDKPEHLVDHYDVFIVGEETEGKTTFEMAKAFYDKLMDNENLYSANLCEIMEATDYTIDNKNVLAEAIKQRDELVNVLYSFQQTMHEQATADVMEDNESVLEELEIVNALLIKYGKLPIEDSFTWDVITYEGHEYKCREIDDLDNEGQRLTIAPDELNGLLISRETGQPHDNEAMHVDNSICYYATAEEMKLSDIELFNLIYK